jgi:hypothetical protein
MTEHRGGWIGCITADRITAILRCCITASLKNEKRWLGRNLSLNGAMPLRSFLARAECGMLWIGLSGLYLNGVSLCIHISRFLPVNKTSSTGN